MLIDIFVNALLPITGLGLLFGLGLAFASRIFTVKKDELAENLEVTLPGLNCGVCGFAGCAGYAAALARDREGAIALTLCSPGGGAVAVKLGELTGREVVFDPVRKVAQVHCRGGAGTCRYKFKYKGIKDCNALFALYGGDKECPYGCLALGSCIRVCPVDAIFYDSRGLVWVDKDKCITCGKCIDICPTKVMQYIPHEADYFVACNSTDSGGVVRKYCTVGCTGCKICEKKSPEGGYIVDNFLSRIDYNRKGSRKEAADACPPQCIIKNEEII